MRYRFTPYSWVILFAVVAGSALISFSSSWDLLVAEFPFDMRSVIVQARDHSYMVYFLPIAWLGVWAARVHSSASIIVGSAPGRSRLQIVAGQVVPLAVCAGIGWLVGWSPACVLALSSQYWTPVDLVAMLTLLVGVSSLVTIGFLVAIPFGVRVGAFAVPAAILAVMLLPGYTINEWLDGRASSVALSYAWSLSVPGDGGQLVLATEVTRLIFYVLVALTVTLAAGGLAEFRATHQLLAFRAISWLVIPLMVAVVVATIRPLLWVDDPNDQPRCLNDEGFTLCLYQIDEPQRGYIRGVITPMLALMPPKMLAEVKITEDTSWEIDGIYINALWGNREVWLNNELSGLAWNLFMPYRNSCTFDGEAGLLQSDFQSSIVNQVGLRAAAITTDPVLSEKYSKLTMGMFDTSEEADRRLSRLSDVEFRDWYGKILAHARICSLSESDLPT